MCKLVVFDWDGTIVDSASRIVDAVHFAGASLALPQAPRSQIVSTIGLNLESMFSILYPTTSEQTIAVLAARYRQHWSENAQIAMPVFKGAITCLDQLEAAGMMLAIATSKSRYGLQIALRDTGLENRFAVTRTADESCGKPNPQMLFDVLEMTGIDRQHAMMVGDSIYDMQMASNAHVSAIGVSWGAHRSEQLKSAGALAGFDDFNSLSEWLLSRSE